MVKLKEQEIQICLICSLLYCYQSCSSVPPLWTETMWLYTLLFCTKQCHFLIHSKSKASYGSARDYQCAWWALKSRVGLYTENTQENLLAFVTLAKLTREPHVPLAIGMEHVGIYNLANTETIYVCMSFMDASLCLSGTKLYAPVWEVVEILSSAASDGASLNHQFPIMQNYAESIIRYWIYTLIVISISSSVILHICWKQLEIVSAIQELIQRVTIWW